MQQLLREIEEEEKEIDLTFNDNKTKIRRWEFTCNTLYIFVFFNSSPIEWVKRFNDVVAKSYTVYLFFVMLFNYYIHL